MRSIIQERMHTLAFLKELTALSLKYSIEIRAAYDESIHLETMIGDKGPIESILATDLTFDREANEYTCVLE